MNQVKESVADAVARLIKEADEKSINSIRVVRKMEVGQVLRQGDVYIHRVDDDHKRGKKIAEGKIQLALGQSIGQRHFLVGDLVAYEGTTLPKWCRQGTFLGPLVVLKKRAKNTHPEHAHSSLPAGTYQVTHQLDVKTMRRVAD